MIRKSIFIIVALLLLVSSSAVTAAEVTVDDVIKLHKEGLSGDVIKSFIKNSETVFELNAEDLLKLKKAGVSEEVIKYMLETKAAAKEKEAQKAETAQPQPQTTVPPPGRPGWKERILGTGGAYQWGQINVVEPTGMEYKKKYTSVFYLAVYKKRLILPDKIEEVGQYDPLKNKAYRGGTLYLTDKSLLMYDIYGQKKFELPYDQIKRIKVVVRYSDEVEARYHPLDRFELRVEFKNKGKEHFLIAYTLPKPKAPAPYYGSVKDIAESLYELARKRNPKLPRPKSS